MKKTYLLIILVIFTIIFSALIVSAESSFDLSKYPSPFLKNDKFSGGVLVIGKEGPAEDTIAITNIALGLQAESETKLPQTMTKMDSELTNLNQNIISVGNPCNNKITDEIMGSSECSYKLGDGKVGIIYSKNYNGYAHIALYGCNDQITIELAKKLKDHSDYPFSGTSYLLSGDSNLCTYTETNNSQSQTTGSNSNKGNTENNNIVKEPTVEKDLCSVDNDCNDNDISTLDKCTGTPKKCSNKKIVDCITGDGYCPANCKFKNDSDCDECMKSEDCNDNDPCTTKSCDGTPRRCSSKKSGGCNINGSCVPVGTITGSKFCDAANGLTEQKAKGEPCSSNSECKSNICTGNKCVQPGFFKIITLWFSKLFS